MILALCLSSVAGCDSEKTESVGVKPIQALTGTVDITIVVYLPATDANAPQAVAGLYDGAPSAGTNAKAGPAGGVTPLSLTKIPAGDYAGPICISQTAPDCAPIHADRSTQVAAYANAKEAVGLSESIYQMIVAGTYAPPTGQAFRPKRIIVTLPANAALFVGTNVLCVKQPAQPQCTAVIPKEIPLLLSNPLPAAGQQAYYANLALADAVLALSEYPPAK